MSRIHQDSDFALPHLVGDTLSELISDYENNLLEPVRLFMKIGPGWHCCFLNAGIAFWETGYPPEDDDEQFHQSDLASHFAIELPATIRNITCIDSTIKLSIESTGVLIFSFASTEPFDEQMRLKFVQAAV